MLYCQRANIHIPVYSKQHPIVYVVVVVRCVVVLYAHTGTVVNNSYKFYFSHYK